MSMSVIGWKSLILQYGQLDLFITSENITDKIFITNKQYVLCMHIMILGHYSFEMHSNGLKYVFYDM